MASREATLLLPSYSALPEYGAADRRSSLRTRLTNRRGIQAVVFAAAAALLFCATTFYLTPMSLLSAPQTTPPHHITTSPIPVVKTEINSAEHELKDAATHQTHSIQSDTEEKDAFKRKHDDMHKAAELEGKLAAAQKKSAQGKAVHAVEGELRRIDSEESGVELGEHALHKDQAAADAVLTRIQEEEDAIAEAEKNHHADGTLLGHSKADLISESRLHAKIGSETGAFVAAAHSYESDSAHVLGEEDTIADQLHGDEDQSDQKEVHNVLLDAHVQQEKENTALGQEIDGDLAVLSDFNDISKDDDTVQQQEADNAAAGGLTSDAKSKSSAK